jgi:hypothetical protein
MSTQRRENRWQRSSSTVGGISLRQFVPEGVQSAGSPGQAGPVPIAHSARAYANGGTAPPATSACHPSDEGLSPVATAWLATNSLQSDHRTIQFARFLQIVRLVRQDIRRGSPPPGAGRRATTGTPATHRSSLPLIPFPSGFAHLRPTLPQFPAGQCRWTERYDGKRDLHLQYAA